MPLKPRTLVIGFLAAVLLSSCASEAVKEQARKEKAAKQAHKGEYVDYYPVGSNIPIKIPKDDPRAKASQKETDDTEAIFREVQRDTQTVETGPQSGIPGAQHGTNAPGPK